MSKSQRPSAREVRDVVRLAWEAAELKRDLATQQQVLIDALVRKFNAEHGLAMRMANYLPGQKPTFGYALTSRVVHPDLPQCLAEWGRDWGIEADPTARLTMAMNGPVICEGMRQHLSDEAWCTEPVYEWIHERMNVTDIMPLMFRRREGHEVTAWSLHRLDGHRRFSRREVALGRLFVGEMHYLYRTDRLESPDAHVPT